MEAVKLAKDIPNFLTFLRLALIPVFVLLMIDPSPAMVWAATAVFMVASFTDYLDGFLARRWGVVSDLGKLLDPLADKILVMTALVMLVAQRSDVYGEPWVPGWMVVMVLAREFWITGIRGIAAKRGHVMAAKMSGKIKSALQMGAIFLLLLHDLSFTVSGFVITCELMGSNLLLASIVVSYVGAMEYTQEVLRAEL